MSIPSRTSLLQHGISIDLTLDEPMLSSSSALQPGHGRQLVDLTEPILPQDHMHSVIDLLRPRTVDTKIAAAGLDGKEETTNASSPPCYRQKTHPLRSSNSSSRSILSNFQAATEVLRAEIATLSALSTLDRLDSTTFGRQHVRRYRKKPFKPFPFSSLPPEIRNFVYRFLLTTPNAPIELPKLTGRYGAVRAAQWANCTTPKMRRRHKTIFLEILEICK